MNDNANVNVSDKKDKEIEILKSILVQQMHLGQNILRNVKPLNRNY